MARIHWKAEEWDKVFASYHNLVENSQLAPRTEDNWDKAQRAVLPKERWRSFKLSASVTDLNKRYRELVSSGQLKKKVQAIQVAKPPTPAQPPEGLVTVPGVGPLRLSTFNAVVAMYRMQNPPPPPPVVTMDTMMRQMFAEELHKKMPEVFEQMDIRLKGFLENIEAEMEELYVKFMMSIDPNWKKASEPETELPEELARGETRPLIIAVNANAAQEQSLQKEFERSFIIKAVRDREPYGNPLLVLGFTRFMSQTLDDRCAKKFKDAYVRVTGAASDAKHKLRARLGTMGLMFEA